jgi:hypothetical protein
VWEKGKNIREKGKRRRGEYVDVEEDDVKEG